MKLPFLVLLGSVVATIGAWASEVAVLDIRVGKEKATERVVIEFYEEAAPRTVANFKELVRSRFYNGTAFHRAFPGIMLQGGDPLSRKKDRSNVGTGGPGYTIPLEISNRKHVPGAVAMARLPDKINPARVSNGSQFYFVLAPMPDLDRQYTVFGNVIAGREALEAISKKATDTNDYPVDRVEIVKAHIVPLGAENSVRPPRRGFFGWFK